MTFENIQVLVLSSSLSLFALGHLMVNLAQKYPHQTLRIVNRLRRIVGAGEVKPPRST